MNRSESKYYNTACLMDEAFLLILETKDFEYITVKEICEKAGVNRSTFYLHYETMTDLLDESMNFVNDRFLEYFRAEDLEIADRISSCSVDELYLVTPRYLLPYLEFIGDHKKLFGSVVKKHALFQLDKTYERLFQGVFDPILERFNAPEEQRRFVMSFYVNGLMAIVTEWLRTDCKETPSEIMEIMQNCVKRR